MYGTSAGAFLTAEVLAELRKLKLPLPAVLGIFAGGGDLSQSGDSEALFDLAGLSESIEPPKPNDFYTEYMGSTDPKDPVTMQEAKLLAQHLHLQDRVRTADKSPNSLCE